MEPEKKTPAIAQFFKSIAVSLGEGCLGTPTVIDGKNALLFMQIAYFIVLIVLRETASSYVPDSICRNDLKRDHCLRDEVSVRLSIALMLDFAFLLLLTLCTFGYTALTKFFLLKLSAPIAIFFGLLYIPDGWLYTLEIICGVFCFINFLFLMVFVLNFAVKWNDLWTANSLEDQRKMKSGTIWLYALVFFSVLFIAVSTIITGYYGSKTNDVATSQPFNVLIANYVVMFVILIVSLLSIISHGSLLVSSVIMSFLTTVCWGAALRYHITLTSLEDINKKRIIDELPEIKILPDQYGDYTQHDHNGFIAMMAIFLLFALVTTAREEKPVSGTEGPAEVDVGITQLDTSGGDDGEFSVDMESGDGKKEKKKASSPDIPYVPALLYFLFHISIAGAIGTFFNRTPNQYVFWLYCSASWLGIVLYTWYLIAPLVLGGKRDFS